MNFPRGFTIELNISMKSQKIKIQFNALFLNDLAKLRNKFLTQIWHKKKEHKSPDDQIDKTYLTWSL